jgi:HlyD family secretion protein
MTGPGLFRQRALERIGSPDEFDRLVRVTSPRHWIGLTGLLVVVVAAVLWAFFSTIPTTEQGSGFLLPEGGLRPIQAPVQGELGSLEAEEGGHVVDGQRLGFVTNAAGVKAPVRSTGTGVISEVNGQRGGHVDAGDQLGLVEPIGAPAVVYTYLPTDSVSDVEPGTVARVRFAGDIGAKNGDAFGTVTSVARFPTSAQRLEFVLHGAAVTARPKRDTPTSEVVVTLDQSAATPSGLVWASGDGQDSVPLGLEAKVELVIGDRHPIDDVF